MNQKSETNIDISEVREKARDKYNQLSHVNCPYLNSEVYFNSEGFNHIRYKSARRERKVTTQKIRYDLLRLASKVIEKSSTLQEFHEEDVVIDIKVKGRRKKEVKHIKYYAFIAIIEGWKTKVIVRQIEKGKISFWSIIPNWKTRKSKEGNSFMNYTGNLAEN